VTLKMQHLSSASLSQQPLTSSRCHSAAAGEMFDNKQSLKFNDAIQRNATQYTMRLFLPSRESSRAETCPRPDRAMCSMVYRVCQYQQDLVALRETIAGFLNFFWSCSYLPMSSKKIWKKTYTYRESFLWQP